MPQCHMVEWTYLKTLCKVRVLGQSPRAGEGGYSLSVPPWLQPRSSQHPSRRPVPEFFRGRGLFGHMLRSALSKQPIPGAHSVRQLHVASDSMSGSGGFRFSFRQLAEHVLRGSGCLCDLRQARAMRSWHTARERIRCLLNMGKTPKAVTRCQGAGTSQWPLQGLVAKPISDMWTKHVQRHKGLLGS